MNSNENNNDIKLPLTRKKQRQNAMQMIYQMDIKDEFDGRVNVIVDGGDSDIGIESTVVKVIDNIPVILRPGFITEDDIKKVVRSS